MTSCPITAGLAKKIFPIFPIDPLQVLGGCSKVSLQPSLLEAEQPQLSQLFVVGEVLQPLDHLCGPPLDPLQQLHVLLVLRAPELDAGLQVASHQSRVEGQNCLPRPAGHASLDATQDTVGLLGCSCQAFHSPVPPSPSPQGCSQSAKLLRVYSVLLSMSLMKILYSTAPSTDP